MASSFDPTPIAKPSTYCFYDTYSILLGAILHEAKTFVAMIVFSHYECPPGSLGTQQDPRDMQFIDRIQVEELSLVRFPVRFFDQTADS